MATHEVTVKVSDTIYEEIKRYKKSSHKKSTEDAVAALIKHALTLPLYFTQFDWERAEEEADKEIAAGKIESFNSVEDFLTDMKK